MRRRFVFGIVFGLLVFAVTGVALAQSGGQPVTDDQVNRIAKQLYCPVCENIPLDVCGTQACEEWRLEIRSMLAAGKHEADIKQYFADRFGDRVLAAPPARGLNWMVYLMPPVLILVGAFILYRAFRQWRQPAEAPQASLVRPASEPPADEYIARFEEESRKR